MSDTRSTAGSFDLTGAWSGVVSSDRSFAPTPFTALLDETLGWILGSTEERGGPGQGRCGARATLQGRREGRAVTFLKTYDLGTALYDTVSFTGELCLDGTEIAGAWSSDGWSGEFLMVRTPPDRETMIRNVYQASYAIGDEPIYRR